MIDVFDLRFYWGGRKENTFEFAERLHKLLLALNEINPFLTEWCLTANSKKESLRSPFTVDLKNIELLLRKSMRKNEISDDGFSKLGFRLTLFKEDDEGNQYSLKFFGGYGGDLFPNNCIASFWDPMKFCKSEIFSVVEAIVNFLEPQYGCLISSEFEE